MKKLIKVLRSCDLTALYEEATSVNPSQVEGDGRYIRYALMYNRSSGKLFFLISAEISRERNTMQHALTRSLQGRWLHLASLSASQIDNGLPAVRLAECYGSFF